MPKSAKTSGRKNWRATLRLLTALEHGLLVLDVRGRYRYAYMEDGLAGVRRLVASEERRRVLKRLRDLRRGKLIEERRIGSRLRFKLTRVGGAYRLKLLLKSAALLPQNEQVLLTFDVPERYKPLRERLRTLLKTSGFRMVHHSVWITRRDAAGHLRKYLAAEGLDRWIRWFRVQEIV